MDVDVIPTELEWRMFCALASLDFVVIILYTVVFFSEREMQANNLCFHYSRLENKKLQFLDCMLISQAIGTVGEFSKEMIENM